MLLTYYAQFLFFLSEKRRHIYFWTFYVTSALLINQWMFPKSKPFANFILNLFLILVFYKLVGIFKKLINHRYKGKYILRLLVNLVLWSFAAYTVLELILPLIGFPIRKEGHAFILVQFAQYCLLGFVRYSEYAITYVYFQRKVQVEQENNKLLQEQILQQRAMAAMEQAKMKAMEESNRFMLRMYAAQIHPHFLHNGFSLMQSRALHHQDELLEKAVTYLSSIMDYALQCSRSDMPVVLLRRELDYLESMIALVHLKHHSEECLLFTLEGNIRGLAIPPFLFITIVENAIKHGEVSAEDPVRISLKISNSIIYFTCSNKKKRVIHDVTSNGTGLLNVEKRLSILFPNNYSLKTDNTGDYFHLNLIIKYDKHRTTEMYGLG
jgi:two-component system, LytTR family, sensor kinase